MKNFTFPISQIRGRFPIGERVLHNHIASGLAYKGLVDDFSVYKEDIAVDSMSSTIRDFYENTNNYALFAKVKWHTWFKPFAAVYRVVSMILKQINLPLSNEEMEMTGAIVPIKEEDDGRISPRAWIRKINGKVCFVAIYSYHRTGNSTYMNIGLPLPGATLLGILQLEQCGNSLKLSSKKCRSQASDAGTYLSTKHFLWKVPIEEQFYVEERSPGHLIATHRMWICSIPFLSIQYRICHQ